MLILQRNTKPVVRSNTMDNIFIDKSKLANADFGESNVGRALGHITKAFDIGVNEYGLAVLSRKQQGKNRETYLSSSARFAQILREEMMLSLGLTLDKSQVLEIKDKLDGIAGINSETCAPYLRVAPTSCGEGRILDVCNRNGTQYQLLNGLVTQIEKDSDVLFISSKDAESLPTLVSEGNWKKLLPYLNMEKRHQFLFIAWLLHTITLVRAPDTAYPLLVVYGGQGTGKSTFCKRIIRALLDPRAAKVKSFPSDKENLAIALQNEFCSIYDNMRTLTAEWSDYLCIAATYGVEEKRKLYSDGDSIKFSLHGSLVLNGIHDFIKEPDLASRSIYISMQQLTAEQRVNSKVMLKKLDDELPEIYTGLLQLLAKILQALPLVTLTQAGRLDEFSRFLAAFEMVTGIQNGYLQNLYLKNQKDSALEALYLNKLAKPLINIAKKVGVNGMKFTPSELFDELIRTTPCHEQKGEFPKNPIQLGLRVDGLISSLGMAGIRIERVAPKNSIFIAMEHPESIAA
ncbi:RNA helicase domain-containing protein [Vibrio vulnificus]|nr:RNA helicase domain-containing protein [Vibrio vulnificus]